ncbi:MAG: hypothetical protein JNM36_14305 [Chitinophagales bacterium]|nr:hypothetical protein [Chitinophagales bacterium]
MKQLIILITLLLMVVACDNKVKDNFPGTYPCCYQSSIDNILSIPPTTPRHQLDKYYFQDQYVYVFNGPALYPDELVATSDERCEAVCYSGGIVGFVCDDWEDAEFIEVVWKDPR